MLFGPGQGVGGLGKGGNGLQAGCVQPVAPALAVGWLTPAGRRIGQPQRALTGMAANGTVAFGGLSTAGSNYTVALADATGGADVLNYVLASTVVNAPGTLGTAINAGTITVSAPRTPSLRSRC